MTHTSFILRCWLLDDGRLGGYLLEIPTRLRHPFVGEKELAQIVLRLIMSSTTAK
ncbi:MAG: hypothetical protein GXP38_08540 [Chloroflexi bacterium]|nr:hypothetical protein [Chloroflexota bacterium]